VATLEINWSEEKNRKLKAERGLAFEDVVAAIENGRILADIDHHHAARKGRQKILAVELDGYVCAVPYLRQEQKMFLKTVFKSRALHKRYGRSK
jgi:uncharacterized DUF497 family protein